MDVDRRTAGRLEDLPHLDGLNAQSIHAKMFELYVYVFFGEGFFDSFKKFQHL